MKPGIAAAWLAAALGCDMGSAMAVEPPPKAPPADSPALYVTGGQLAAALQAAIAAGREPAVSQIASTDEYFINQVHRSKTGVPNAHPGWTEVHIILRGSGTLVTGGRIVARSDGTKIILDGLSRQLAAGDMVIVPAATPHWYSKIDGQLDAIEVRFLKPAPGSPIQ